MLINGSNVKNKPERYVHIKQILLKRYKYVYVCKSKHRKNIYIYISYMIISSKADSKMQICLLIHCTNK